MNAIPPHFDSRQVKDMKKTGNMSRTRPKGKRRGGARDESNLTICLNRSELALLLERTRRRCEEYERRQRFAIKDKLLNIKML